MNEVSGLYKVLHKAVCKLSGLRSFTLAWCIKVSSLPCDPVGRQHVNSERKKEIVLPWYEYHELLDYQNLYRCPTSSEKPNSNKKASIMYLASLNVDVLLYLIDFIDPVDRFNLALSGILLGLENVNKGMDLKRRYFQHISHYRLCKFCNMQYIICSIYPDMNFGNWNWGYPEMARMNQKSGKCKLWE